MHLRLLCAQTTTGSAVYMLDEDGAVVPFYVFASDGAERPAAPGHHPPRSQNAGPCVRG